MGLVTLAVFSQGAGVPFFFTGGGDRLEAYLSGLVF